MTVAERATVSLNGAWYNIPTGSPTEIQITA